MSKKLKITLIWVKTILTIPPDIRQKNGRISGQFSIRCNSKSREGYTQFNGYTRLNLKYDTKTLKNIGIIVSLYKCLYFFRELRRVERGGHPAKSYGGDDPCSQGKKHMLYSVVTNPNNEEEKN